MRTNHTWAVLLLGSTLLTTSSAFLSSPRASTRFFGWKTALPSSTTGTGTGTGNNNNINDDVLPEITAITPLEQMRDEYDVVVVGSGIGGLSCAAILALYGNSVAVMESHYAPGGAAHGYTVPKKGIGSFHFDTGPSFFSGLNPNLPPRSSNPLRTILDAIEERVEIIPYTSFGLKFPEGDLLHTTNFGGHNNPNEPSPLEQVAGPKAKDEWKRLMEQMKPLEKAVDAMPTAALRGDLSALLTAAPFLKNFATLNPLENFKLTAPFSKILDQAEVNTTFTRNWIDLLCFCLSGLPSKGTITAEMAMMMGEFYDAEATMDCPKGGANSIVAALVRGIQKHGGHVFCNSHVQEISIVDGKANGVQLKRNNRKIQAKKAVVSNLSIWDLLNSGILDTDALPKSYVENGKETPVGMSFMHLHVGFKATRKELGELQAHYICLKDWSRGVEAEDNAVLVSIPSVHDNSLAPEGYGVLHAYTPATEEYERWSNLKRNSEEYNNLKEDRSQYLWERLEGIIPDIRKRAEIVQVGTPLTHERFLRRYKGSYGPAIVAGEGSFPFPKTPIKDLLVCGDSCFPGIGVPAVAGSGLLAANTVSLDSIPRQRKMLKKMHDKIATATTVSTAVVSGSSSVTTDSFMTTNRRNLFAIGVASAGSMFLAANPAFAAKDPYEADKQKLLAGYKRLNFLLDNWVQETSDCKTKTQYSSASSPCERTPLKVQNYLGYKSIDDPLFRADKTMRRLEGLVPSEDVVDYLDAMETFSEKAEEGSGMAFVSSWGEANPGGGKDRVELFVERAKNDVIAARDALGVILKILKVID